MYLDEVLARTQEKFPKTNFIYKDQTLFIRLFSKAMSFMAPTFSTDYATSIGNTIYLPVEKYFKNRPINSAVLLCHEAVHLHDNEKFNKYLFSFLYLCPQILGLIALPIMLFKFWIGLLFLVCLLPIPSVTRAYFEYRAYCINLYASYRICRVKKFSINLDEITDEIKPLFKKSIYYYMMPIDFILNYFFDKAKKAVMENYFPLNDDKLKEKIDYILFG